MDALTLIDASLFRMSCQVHQDVMSFNSRAAATRHIKAVVSQLYKPSREFTLEELLFPEPVTQDPWTGLGLTSNWTCVFCDCH
jgi:hypothetical protein